LIFLLENGRHLRGKKKKKGKWKKKMGHIERSPAIFFSTKKKGMGTAPQRKEGERKKEKDPTQGGGKRTKEKKGMKGGEKKK